MERGFKFENLRIWQKAMDLGEEMYNLSSHLRRAADSIALNISERSILQSDAEFRRFLGYAIRSPAEVVTCLHKAKRRNYLDEHVFKTHYMDSRNLLNMMIGFRNKLG
ncbi:four helix bundle protein [bacterium AH-315-B15]|nr:four helix bundle protein [bacterium AH-315-B15]MBN4082073.1 four helix bundle protein [bacterium AH-315-B15]